MFSGAATTSVREVGEGVGLGRSLVGAPSLSADSNLAGGNGGPATDSYRANAPVRRRRRDRGQTFVEILVSIVLLGTAVGGTLTALRTTIVSSKHDDAQAKASAWLREAEDVIYRTEYKPCTSFDVGQVTSAYDTAAQGTPPPEGWAGGSVGVNVVYFWSKSDGLEVWSAVCGAGSTAQLVEIYVLSPDGAVGKTIQVIKRGS